MNLMSTGNFNNDLIIGKKIENEICEIIKIKYPRAYVKKGYEKGFDVVVPEILIEVKYDEMSHQTGNYLIETEYGGNPSGLSTTTADFWAIVDKEIIVWVTTESLRYFVRNYKEVALTGRGDSKAKKGYLIPKEELQSSPYITIQKRT